MLPKLLSRRGVLGFKPQVTQFDPPVSGVQIARFWPGENPLCGHGFGHLQRSDPVVRGTITPGEIVDVEYVYSQLVLF